jgi:molybdenum cofactor cytidylyltransferase
MLAAVILAGGASRRMGFPKALLPFRGGTFLGHLMKVVADDARIGVRKVVLGAEAAKIARAAGMRDEEIVVNAEWERGQLSSIQAGIRALPAGTDGILLWPVDHALVGAELVGELIGKFHSSGAAVVLPVFVGRRGHPVIFAARLFEELLSAPEETGARAVVWAHAGEVVEVPTGEEGCVLNLNDPETYRKFVAE